MAVLAGKGDEAPPGLGGEAGLHAVGIAAVIAAAGLQKLVGGRDRPIYDFTVGETLPGDIQCF